MKKRLRKKLHRGEFQQYGISIWVPVNTENIESTLDLMTNIAENNSILFCGGGLGRFVLPSEEYGDLQMPSKVESLISNIAFSPDTISDCVIGYFVHPTENKISQNVSDIIKTELEEKFQTEFKINCRIGLWD